MASRKYTYNQKSLQTFSQTAVINQTGEIPRNTRDISELLLIPINVETGAEEISESIKLVGNQLPHQPLSHPAGIEVMSEYYPGGQEGRTPNIQVLGSVDDNITIEGNLKSLYIKDRGRRNTPLDMSRQLISLAKSGKPMRLSLGYLNKYVMFLRFDPKYKTNSDIDYMAEFLVIGDTNPVTGDRSTASVALPGTRVFADDTDLIVEVDEIVAEIEARQEPAFEYTKDLRSTIATREEGEISTSVLNSMSNSFKDASSSISRFSQRLVDSPSEIIERNKVLSDIFEAKDNITKGKRQLTGSIGAVQHHNGLNAMRITSTYNNVTSYGNKLTEVLKTSEDKIDAQSLQGIRDVHIVKQGQTLQDISSIYYGSHEGYERIKEANASNLK